MPDDLPHEEMLIANSQADAAIDAIIEMRRSFLEQLKNDWTNTAFGAIPGIGERRAEVKVDAGSESHAGG